MDDLPMAPGCALDERGLRLQLDRYRRTGRQARLIEETIQDGERIVVAFRPEQPFQGERPLDDGIAYVVVTMRDGQIVEMKGCADRANAISHVQTG